MFDAKQSANDSWFTFDQPNHSRIHRRQFVLAALSLGFTGSLLGKPQRAFANQASTYRLNDSMPTYRKVRATLDVEGKVRINPDGKKVREFPMSLNGQYEYDERLMPKPLLKRTVRYYSKAHTKTQVSGQPGEAGIDPVKKLIVNDFTGGPQSVIFCPEFSLTREELELITIPGNSLATSLLLPNDPVTIGQTWEVLDAGLVGILNLDAISKNEVIGKLTQVEDQVATIELEGKVAGAVGGVATDVELRGKINFDLEANTITWFAAQISEERSIGHAHPGFVIKAVVRTQMEPISEVAQLSDSAIAQLNLEPDMGQQMLLFEGREIGCRFMHPRDWHAMGETGKATVFRLIRDGELLAQCNISRLTNLKAGEQTTLEGFQANVSSALGERLGQVMDAAERVTSEGLRELRITAVGTAEKLPITWVYYLMSDDTGRRYSLVFTYETTLTEKVAEADRTFTSGFSMLELEGPKAAQVKEEPEAKTASRVKLEG